MTSEESLRVRGYLTAQGAKLSPEQIIGKVQEAMSQLRAAAAAVPTARFTDPPAPGEWSANEVMAHVVEAGRHFGGAIVRVLDGQPPGQPRDVAARDTTPRPLDEWWAMLERDRTALFQRVRSAHPTARLEATIAPPKWRPASTTWAMTWLALHSSGAGGSSNRAAGTAVASVHS